MLSPLAAWRVSLQRMRSDWSIVAAAWLVTLLAATLLAAGPIYSDAVSLASLRQVLADARVVDANIEVSARLGVDELEERSADVERVLTNTVGRVGVQVERSAASDTYALPDQGDEVRDLAVFGFMDGIADHATLLEGSWPQTAAPSDPVQVAISGEIADLLAWEVGDQFDLPNRADDTRVVPAVVSAVYGIDDARDPFWWADQQALEGFVESESYRTIGPLVTTRSDLMGRIAPERVRVTWHAFPAHQRLTLADIGGLRGRLGELQDRVRQVVGDRFPSASTGLDHILGDTERSLLVSRTGVLLLIVQLAILAAYAIVLTAGLLVDHRRIGTALLRSRGAGPLQVAGMALAEALFLAVPAALLAPLVAAGALTALNVIGPLASTQLEIVPQPSQAAFIAAGLAAVGCALLLVLPAFIAARSFAQEEGGRSRFETRTFGQRLGIDIALLAVTVIGFWQLRLYGAPLTRSVRGTLGLDPLLVAAPAIGLLAGSVLALRMVPLLAIAAEAITKRGRRLVSSLGAQQVARRPLRYTRAALLLMLAVSMGVFAVSYSATWRTSQADQASYQVGADVRLEASTAVGNVPAWAMRGALDRIPGIAGILPLERQTLRLSRAAGSGEIIGLDPSTTVAVARMRNDQAASSLAELVAPLADERVAPTLVSLPGTPLRLRVDADVALDEVLGFSFDPVAGELIREPVEVAELEGNVEVGAEVVIRDGLGVTQRFLATALPYQAGGLQILIPLSPTSPRSAAAVAEAGGTFTGPLQVLGVDITINLPEGWIATRGHVRMAGLGASASSDGEDWQPLDLDEPGAWSLDVLRIGGATVPVSSDQVEDRGLVLGSAGPSGSLPGTRTGLRPPAVSFTPSSLQGIADTNPPAIANQAFLDATATTVGDVVTARLDGGTRQFTITGVLDSFPTTDAERPLLIADLATLELLRYESAHAVRSPDEWWIAADGGQAIAVAAAVSGGPFGGGRATSIEGRTRTLTADPVALGVIGALTLGFVVAGLFAVIGLAVSAAVSARQRRTEFALLRALGLSSAELSGWLWLENAGVVLVSLASGTALGLVIGWVALPFITVTQAAAAPFPPALVRTPWGSIALLVGISAVALAVTVALLGALLRRVGIGSVLRMGED